MNSSLKELNLTNVLNNMDDDKLRSVLKNVDCRRLINLISWVKCKYCPYYLSSHHACVSCGHVGCTMFVSNDGHNDHACIKCLKDESFTISCDSCYMTISASDFFTHLVKIHNPKDNKLPKNKKISYKLVLKLLRKSGKYVD